MNKSRVFNRIIGWLASIMIVVTLALFNVRLYKSDHAVELEIRDRENELSDLLEQQAESTRVHNIIDRVSFFPSTVSRQLESVFDPFPPGQKRNRELLSLDLLHANTANFVSFRPSRFTKNELAVFSRLPGNNEAVVNIALYVDKTNLDILDLDELCLAPIPELICWREFSFDLEPNKVFVVSLENWNGFWSGRRHSIVVKLNSSMQTDQKIGEFDLPEVDIRRANLNRRQTSLTFGGRGNELLLGSRTSADEDGVWYDIRFPQSFITIPAEEPAQQVLVPSLLIRRAR